MIKQGNRQAGGTLLGLILGLVIGLSVAVVVAVMIKNTPLPFTNKVGRPEKAPDAASASTGQIVDPNKSLQGNKEPAREAAKQFAKPEEEAKPGEPALDAKDAARQAAKEPAAKPESRADNKAPVVDKSTAAESRVAKAEPSSAADEKFTYYLQAGAFLEKADAENTKARLALMGVGASIAERKSDNGTLYRVRIGPFAQLEAMNRVRGKLTDNGVDVAVVRVPK
ncbi:SPOR domain-containing protein [Lacisediminimonas profundi]|uniref:SPOR domain-containing protein n=1 Tax=Lacisediminimonas profundi TaxID=2603856 RepID=UPI00124B1C67|nr:SPOR domain-containing protein [Lacisediminimonas profundi]